MKIIVSIFRKPMVLAGTVLALVMGGLLVYGKPWAQVSNNELPSVKSTSRAPSTLLGPLIRIDGKEVQFHDVHGAVKRKISLEEESLVEDDLIDFVGQGIYGPQMVKTKKRVMKHVTLSRDGRILALDVNDSQTGYFDDKGIQYDFDQWKWATGRLEVFDESGTTLWRKQFKEHHAVESTVISDSNEVVAVTTSCYDKYSRDNQEPFGSLYVFNQQGQELFNWPMGNAKYTAILPDELRISPNGQFVSIVAQGSDGKSTSVFFDILHATAWDAGKDYVTYEISNGGERGGPHPSDSRAAPIRWKPWVQAAA
jgi:hypothetical protein